MHWDLHLSRGEKGQEVSAKEVGDVRWRLLVEQNFHWVDLAESHRSAGDASRLRSEVEAVRTLCMVWQMVAKLVVPKEALDAAVK